MKIVGVSYLFDDELFAEVTLKGIYDSVDELLIFIGANKYTLGHWATPDGYPIDRTREIVETFPDPDKKITIFHTIWEDFDQMKACGLEMARQHGADWYFEICSGEVYIKKDLRTIRKTAEEADENIRMIYWPFWTFKPDFHHVYRWPGGEMRLIRVDDDTFLDCEAGLYYGDIPMWSGDDPMSPGTPEYTKEIDVRCFHLDDLKPPINQMHRRIRRIMHWWGRPLDDDVIREAALDETTGEVEEYAGPYPEVLRGHPLFESQKNKKVLYSVVIPLYISSPEKLKIAKRTIETLQECTDDYELIIVDDCSPMNHNLGALADIYIRNHENQGFAKTSNVGLKRATAPIICLLNDDVTVREGWIEKLTGHLSDAVIFISPIVFYEGGQELVNLRHPNGCCIVGTSVNWKDCDYLSEDYGRGYFEDTDLLAMVEKKGKIWRNDGELILNHVGGASFKQLPDQQEIFNTAREIFKNKWGFDAIERYYQN